LKTVTSLSPTNFALFLSILLCYSCYNRDNSSIDISIPTYPKLAKQKGAHVFGALDSSNIKQFHETNIEWITFVPFGSQPDINSPKVRYSRGDSTQTRRRNERWLEKIKTARTAGYKVFFKPHIWMHNPSSGKWRSDIYHDNEQDWVSWKESYSEFILRYAEIAEKGRAEMFCIGAEFTALTKEKPEYWQALIKDVRAIYSGKITYAANWYKEYEQINFWGELDYIGIQAYFPLTSKLEPSVEDLRNGWRKYIADMETVAKKYNRPILFSELGYKSTTDSAIEPWKWVDYEKENTFIRSDQTQINCYQAFFDTVWEKPWFAGIHIWQMRGEPHGSSWDYYLDFTPQGKPVEELIKKEFSK